MTRSQDQNKRYLSRYVIFKKGSKNRLHFLIHSRFKLAAFLILILIFGGMFWFIIDQDETNIAAHLLPPQNYPEVTDLAADAEIDARFASLSYGVHTFLWWNETYRTWDLENIRLLNLSG